MPHSIAALTMVKDDLFFLGAWLDYYGRHFGRKNLYVINHGFEPKVDEIAAGANVIGIPKGDNRKFDVKRWRMLNGIANGLLGYYNQVVVGDVDEFVVADPDIAGSLPEMLQRFSRAHVITPFGLEVVHLPTVEPAPIDAQILGPRRHVQVASDYAKPCILSNFTRIGRGGHFADCDRLTMPEGLYLMHMRYCDLALYSDTMDRRNAVVAETGAKDASEVMIGRHWFANRRRDDEVFAGFEARPRRDGWGFAEARGRMAASWRKRDTNGDLWQFSAEPREELYQIPERFVGLL